MEQDQMGIVEKTAEKVWKFFSSVKLAVVLLIVLAIVSVIGTVIQQNEPPEKYLQEYSQATVQLFEMLGFFDMYHTWWFVLLLFMLTANLTVCTLDRLPPTLKIINAPLKPIDDNGLRALPFKKEIALKESVEKARDRSLKVLQSMGYKPIEAGSPGEYQLVAQKGVYSRLGYVITHISIILIFVGALIGAFFGFKAFLNLPEGQASQYVYLRNEPMWDKIAAALGIAKSPVIHDPEGGVPAMPLGFYLYLDKFDVDYYTGPQGPTGMPSEYHSALSVYNLDQQKLYDKRIRVNDPLQHRGITFYQSSYGPMPDARGVVYLSIRPKNGAGSPQTIGIPPGESLYVPSIQRTVRVLGVMPFGVRNPSTGQPMYYQSNNGEFINPTAELEILKDDKVLYRTAVMKTDNGQPHMPEDYAISYVHYWGTRYTGLQVTKDPGVWIVYTGFILLCVGPLIAFFGSHRKIWIRVQDRKGQSVLTVAASANRNRIGFERKFEKLVQDISK